MRSERIETAYQRFALLKRNVPFHRVRQMLDQIPGAGEADAGDLDDELDSVDLAVPIDIHQDSVEPLVCVPPDIHGAALLARIRLTPALPVKSSRPDRLFWAPLSMNWSLAPGPVSLASWRADSMRLCSGASCAMPATCRVTGTPQAI